MSNRSRSLVNRALENNQRSAPPPQQKALELAVPPVTQRPQHQLPKSTAAKGAPAESRINIADSPHAELISPFETGGIGEEERGSTAEIGITQQKSHREKDADTDPQTTESILERGLNSAGLVATLFHDAEVIKGGDGLNQPLHEKGTEQGEVLGRTTECHHNNILKAKRVLFQENRSIQKSSDKPVDLIDSPEDFSELPEIDINKLPLDGEVIVTSTILTAGDTTESVIFLTPEAGEVDLTEGNILYTEPSHNTSTDEIVVPQATVASEEDPTVTNDHAVTPPSTGKRKRRNRTGSSSPKRKRQKSEHLWKANVRKTLKNSGEAYETSTGKQHPAVQMRGPCACSQDCVHRLKEEQRLSIHRTFWQLGRHDRQWEFIRLNSSVTPTKARKEGQILKRQVSRSYHFTVKTVEVNEDGEEESHDVKIKVCKQMFMRTLGICDSWITSAFKHINPDKGNTVSPDKRGGARKPKNDVTPLKVSYVKEHINLFPRVPSHYCRKRTKREYLEKGLSIAKMARLYQIWARDKGIQSSCIATQRQYRDILNGNFNIGFYKPKKDQCSLCSLMRNKHNTRQIREEKKAAWVTHIKNKKAARALKDKDVAESLKDKSVVACSFDLQKQLSCPQSQDGAFWYHSKLKVFNFTAFCMTERLGDCYLWHEGIGKKGSNEISSALLDYIQNLVSKGYKDLRFWSDNCAGQNKNRFLFCMYEYAAVKYKIKITHRWLEPGHTQMEADSIHARIEKVTESEDIYDFQGWVDWIESAKQELPMYRVKQFNKNTIFSFKDLFAKQNWDYDLRREKVAWTKIKELHINGEEGNLVRMKYDLESPSYITLSPNKPGRPVNLNTYQPPLAYDSLIPLSAETIKGITWLCDNFHVPVTKQDFLRGVLAGVQSVDEEEVSDVDYESDEELCQQDPEDMNNDEDRESSSQEDD